MIVIVHWLKIAFLNITIGQTVPISGYGLGIPRLVLLGMLQFKIQCHPVFLQVMGV